MDSIIEYNKQLINDNIKLNIIDYFKEVHYKFYKDINITFMEYFLEICNKDDKFIIEHSKLKKYKIITSGRSNDIKECLNKLELAENIDFIVRNVPQQQDISRGIRNIKEYMLTPYAFKLCLIRSKNTKVYANYYLLLEKIFKYYNDYQIDYNKNILSIKEAELNKLTKKIKKKSKKIEELNDFIKESLSN
jgi:hypothetical protein